MNDRLSLLAYIATLIALVVVFTAALITAAIQPEVLGKLESFGLGTITGGLIGVLRMPSARNSSSNVESADTVVQNSSDATAGQAGGAGHTA